MFTTRITKSTLQRELLVLALALASQVRHLAFLHYGEGAVTVYSEATMPECLRMSISMPMGQDIQDNRAHLLHSRHGIRPAKTRLHSPMKCGA